LLISSFTQHSVYLNSFSFSLLTEAEKSFAKKQLEVTRERLCLAKLETEASEEALMEAISHLKRCAIDHDLKMKKKATAQTNVAKWRKSLNESGCCKSTCHSLISTY
jgi:hypothetical protein